LDGFGFPSQRQNQPKILNFRTLNQVSTRQPLCLGNSNAVASKTLKSALHSPLANHAWAI